MKTKDFALIVMALVNILGVYSNMQLRKLTKLQTQVMADQQSLIAGLKEYHQREFAFGSTCLIWAYHDQHRAYISDEDWRRMFFRAIDHRKNDMTNYPLISLPDETMTTTEK